MVGKAYVQLLYQRGRVSCEAIASHHEGWDEGKMSHISVGGQSNGFADDREVQVRPRAPVLLPLGDRKQCLTLCLGSSVSSL